MYKQNYFLDFWFSYRIIFNKNVSERKLILKNVIEMHLNIFVVSQLVMVDQSGSKEVSVKWSCLMDWLCNSFYLLVQFIWHT